MSEVERLMFENKIMKLELQRMKPGSGGSGGNFDSDVISTENTSKQNRQSVDPFKRKMSIPDTCPLCNSLPPCAHYKSIDEVKGIGSPKAH